MFLAKPINHYPLTSGEGGPGFGAYPPESQQNLKILTLLSRFPARETSTSIFCSYFLFLPGSSIFKRGLRNYLSTLANFWWIETKAIRTPSKRYSLQKTRNYMYSLKLLGEGKRSARYGSGELASVLFFYLRCYSYVTTRVESDLHLPTCISRETVFT